MGQVEADDWLWPLQGGNEEMPKHKKKSGRLRET